MPSPFISDMALELAFLEWKSEKREETNNEI
jgi:hypothetical protein